MSEEQAHPKSENLAASARKPLLSLQPVYAESPDIPSAEPSISNSQIGESSLGLSPKVPVQKHYWAKDEVSSCKIQCITLK